MQFLREYFGDPTGEACVHCDNCQNPVSPVPLAAPSRSRAIDLAPGGL